MEGACVCGDRSVEPQEMLRILELYSGVGGMHAAARESGVPFEVVGSYEINPTAIEVYCKNFPGSNKPRNILGLTLEELTQLHPDLIMMSPPCQPFTRQGLKRDTEDTRSSSFLHLLNLLNKVPQPPRMILMENVAGYETSQTRDKLVEMLIHRGYVWQEFLLSPTQFKVPNSRLRYYLLARLSQEPFPFATSQVLTEFPFCLCVQSEGMHQPPKAECYRCCKHVMTSVQHLLCKFLTCYHDSSSAADHLCPEFPTLSCYLDTKSNITSLLLEDKVLRKYHMLLDIVDSEFQRSCCFTKGYAHYVEGTGSVLKHNASVDVAEVYSKVQDLDADDPCKLEMLQQLELRYFSPEEVARLMCFPPWFTFPDTTTKKQRYRLLGNSINVLVVTCLLLILVKSQ